MEAMVTLNLRQLVRFRFKVYMDTNNPLPPNYVYSARDFKNALEGNQHPLDASQSNSNYKKGDSNYKRQVMKPSLMARIASAILGVNSNNNNNNNNNNNRGGGGGGGGGGNTA